jgi:1,2-phenylacetyl-CoA epoxidase catalytic subunit
MDREEAYHRMHARMWMEKLEGNEQFEAAFAELWPYALGVLEPAQRGELAKQVGRDEVDAVERGSHDDGFAALHEEMTMVRRSAPGAAW